MAIFTFEPSAQDAIVQPRSSADLGLSGEMLLYDARWFTRIRWCVVFALLGLWLLGLLLAESSTRNFGVVLPRFWPVLVAATLAVLNLISLEWLRRLPADALGEAVIPNIWFQIVSDLVVLAALVYLMGPTDTGIGFAFLFHVVLACIFFDRRRSLLVTLLSAALFLTAVVLSESSLLPHYSILSTPSPVPAIIPSAFTLFVCGVVWYLTSSISEAVRRRGFELDRANARLRQAAVEKNQQMLRITHDLKAPFSGIEGSIHVLRQIHWDSLPEGIQKIVAKIEARSGLLRVRISEILTLGGLRSDSSAREAERSVGLCELLENVREELKELATQKELEVHIEGAEVVVHRDVHQLRILFMNLISNAIMYSSEGGAVDLTLEPLPGGGGRVEVRDHGMGISPDALPHIFEDFYRSREAAAFNLQSTGLGLAIVRQIAQNLSLTIEVSSDVGVGTSFDIRIPAGGA
jgi:two-component system phosphate regulon sensor histidine kinase PhoR